MYNKRINLKTTLFIIFLAILEIIIFLLIFNINRILNPGKIDDLVKISVGGYQFDKEFSLDMYEYNVVVSDDFIDIICDSNTDIYGCNETLDIKDKENYTHKIIVNTEKGKKTYTINIKKATSGSDVVKKKIYIKDIKGNVSEWTSNDIIIVLIMPDDEKYMYSFDGGNNWQDSNTITINENSNLSILAKNMNGEISDSRELVINKIDKIAPYFEINKVSSSTEKVTIEVSSSDNLSGVQGISFNGGKFSNTAKYEIKKPGKYFFEVKDKAGNVSEKKYIEILDSDFVKSKKATTYTVTLKSNGNKIEKESISCTTISESCKVILPGIITNNTIVGWATSSNATKANYMPNTSLDISENITLYAITQNEYTAHFYSNGASSIGSTDQSCIAYNGKACTIKMPNITSSGEVIGWNTDGNAKTALVAINTNSTLNKNMTYYAITKKHYTAHFYSNGATSIGKTEKDCTAYNSEKCIINTPNITSSGEVIGWNTDKNAKTALVGINVDTVLNGDIDYYAITKKTFVATFDSTNLDYKVSSKSCEVYNSTKSCTITLPYYNRKGYFNQYWSEENNGNIDFLANNITKKSSNFLATGQSYTLNGNITLYPNFNSGYYADDSYKNTIGKFRKISIQSSKTIGNTLYEFENGIPTSAINTFISYMNDVYNAMPWLFGHGKIFVFTESTYNIYSSAYGKTFGTNPASFIIDLKYDSSNKEISPNAGIHELGHAWDHYYGLKKGTKIRDSSDFKNFYDSLGVNLQLSYGEAWAAATSDYYWHVLERDKNRAYYMLSSATKPEDRNRMLSDAQLTQLKKIILKNSKL